MSRRSRAQQHRTSLGNTRIYRGGGVKPITPDERSTEMKPSTHGLEICHECGADVPLIRATYNNTPITDSAVKIGSLILTMHRPLGGKVSVRLGDVPCRGSLTNPIAYPNGGDQ